MTNDLLGRILRNLCPNPTGDGRNAGQELARLSWLGITLAGVGGLLAGTGAYAPLGEHRTTWFLAGLGLLVISWAAWWTATPHPRVVVLAPGKGPASRAPPRGRKV